MQIDKTTLNDLAIFHHEESQSVFQMLNVAQTNGGKHYLRQLIANPLDNIDDILDNQRTIQQLQLFHQELPQTITNGTIMVIEQYYSMVLSTFPARPNTLNCFFYQVFNKTDFAAIKYSTEHFIGFINDLVLIKSILAANKSSKRIQQWVIEIAKFQSLPQIQQMTEYNSKHKLSAQQVIEFGYYIKYSIKQQAHVLIAIHHEFDAFLSLANACSKYQLHFPIITETEQPFFEAKGLHHILLKQPVSYEISLIPTSNFLFLTGANMAGKSTFIKAIGIAVYLAHLGMGVPAIEMRLSLMDGLLTNIQVQDNISKGESYFYNEVKRVKRTVEQVNNGKKWLILIDELFKGTNVEDAMKCSIAVIEGLRKKKSSLFILSTHLYEIAQSLLHYSNIDFKYFETGLSKQELKFSYQLLNGVSRDRLGYLILEKEGVVKLLEDL